MSGDMEGSKASTLEEEGPGAMPIPHSNHYSPDTVTLRLQYMSDKVTRVAAFVGRSTSVASGVFLIYELVAKLSWEEDYLYTHNRITMLNTIVSSICVGALLVSGSILSWRLYKVKRAGKRWWSRQKRIVSFMCTQLVIQLVNAVFYLAPNAYYLVNYESCPWHLLPINVFGFIRWTCWAALFFLFVIQAHSMLPAHVILTHPLMKPLVWAFAKRWPPPPPMEGLMGYDLPFWALLPELLLLWVPAQASVIVLLLWLTGGIGPMPMCTSIYEEGCHPADALPAKAGLPCREWGWSCKLRDIGVYYAITSTMTAFFLLMIVVYLGFMYIAQRELAKLPYTKYRVPNVGMKLLKRIHVINAGIFFLCLTFMWYIRTGTCNSYILTWFGLLPMQLSMTSMAVINVVMLAPVDPSPRQLHHHQCLQEVAWREQDAEAAMEAAAAMRADSAARERQAQKAGSEEGTMAGAAAFTAAAATAPVRAAAAALLGRAAGAEEPIEPMFCFETALKAMYFSNLMYYHKEIEDAPFTLETALELYDLKHTEMLWQKEPTDTKCLLAWGDGIIVIGFRGTASMANVLADIKLWRAVHPPQRGNYWLWRCPMVHQGFLDAYKAGGLNQRLLQRVREIVGGGSPPGSSTSGADIASEDLNSCSVGADGTGSGEDSPADKQGSADLEAGEAAGKGGGGRRRRRWRVLCTGHSLGGALATLASYDVAKEAERLRAGGLDVQVQLYTFGSPRPGNHAFAKDFQRVVADGWDVIHSNDAVAKNGKFYVMYKRAANRVLVTAEGDILPRPSFLESSLQRGPGSSIKLHLLRAYARSFAAVIRGQFKSKAQGEASRDALRMLLGEKFVREMLGSRLSRQHDHSRAHLKRCSSKEPSIYEMIEQGSIPTSPRATAEKEAAPVDAEVAALSGGHLDSQPPPPPPEQQQETWEAAGQAEAAQAAEGQLLGEAAGDVGPGAPLEEEVGDMHVASGRPLQPPSFEARLSRGRTLGRLRSFASRARSSSGVGE